MAHLKSQWMAGYCRKQMEETTGEYQSGFPSMILSSSTGWLHRKLIYWLPVLTLWIGSVDHIECPCLPNLIKYCLFHWSL